MNHFAFGMLSAIGAIAFPALYVATRFLRGFGAWVQRSEAPRERFMVMVVITAVFGFFAGSLAQSLWNQAQICRAEGQALIPCTLTAASARGVNQ